MPAPGPSLSDLRRRRKRRGGRRCARRSDRAPGQVWRTWARQGHWSREPPNRPLRSGRGFHRRPSRRRSCRRREPATRSSWLPTETAARVLPDHSLVRAALNRKPCHGGDSAPVGTAKARPGCFLRRRRRGGRSPDEHKNRDPRANATSFTEQGILHLVHETGVVQRLIDAASECKYRSEPVAMRVRRIGTSRLSTRSAPRPVPQAASLRRPSPPVLRSREPRPHRAWVPAPRPQPRRGPRR